MNKNKIKNRERIDPGESIKRAKATAKKEIRPYDTDPPEYSMVSEGTDYYWSSSMERIEIIRKGIPYSYIPKLSNKMGTTIKEILELLGIPQTTYNKKRRDQALFNERDSELIMHIVELMEAGKRTFNYEDDKFHRWMEKPNPSLGGHTPMSLLDSNTGIQEVRNCLNRIEYGNMA